MEQFIAVVLENVYAVVIGMLAVGGGLAYLGVSLPAVLLFLLAGLLLMFVSGRREAAQNSLEADGA